MIPISPIITYARVTVDYQCLQAKLLKPSYAPDKVSIASPNQTLELKSKLQEQNLLLPQPASGLNCSSM